MKTQEPAKQPCNSLDDLSQFPFGETEGSFVAFDTEGEVIASGRSTRAQILDCLLVVNQEGGENICRFSKGQAVVTHTEDGLLVNLKDLGNVIFG